MKQATVPSLNIVTPSFNQGRFILQTIESVLSQDDPVLIYWVMDGGSTDNTVDVLKSFGRKINWVSQKDKGQTDAINKGIEKTLQTASDDDIYAYINSDDYYQPGAFARVRSYFNAHPTCDWVIGDAVIVDEKGSEIQKLIRLYKSIFRLVPFSLWIGNSYPQPSVFLRARLIKKIGLFKNELHYVMDYEYWLRATTQCGTPGFLDIPLSEFRIHPDSKGTTQFTKQFQEGYEVVRRYTKNTLVLALHKIHNQCILFIYRHIK